MIYGDKFLWDSLIGTKEVQYTYDSGYVQALKETTFYQETLKQSIGRRLNDAPDTEYLPTVNIGSSGDLWQYTLNNFRYSVLVRRNEQQKLYDLDILITDNYDFHEYSRERTF